MAVMGAGYGGYSAALAMTRHPGVFKAAIVEAASTNLDHDIEKLSSTWDLQLGEYKRYLGGPDKGGGIEQLRERSLPCRECPGCDPHHSRHAGR